MPNVKELKELSRAEIMIKPYTMQQLAEMYFVSPKTFRAWLMSIKLGPKRGRYYSVAQVDVIIKELGFPYRMKEPD